MIRKTTENYSQLVAFVTCLARRWKCLIFPRLRCPTLCEHRRAWPPRVFPCRCQPLGSPTHFATFERGMERLAIKIKCRANSARWRTLRLNVRDWVRFARELWRLSNPRLIPIARDFISATIHVESCIGDLDRPSTFRFATRTRSRCPSKSSFFPQSPITLYQNRHNGPFDLCWWFFLLHLPPRLRQSSNHLRKRRKTILQLRSMSDGRG